MEDERGSVSEATVKIDSNDEGRSDADGKLILDNKYKIGTSLSIEITKTGYIPMSTMKKVEGNNEEDSIITIVIFGKFT